MSSNEPTATAAGDEEMQNATAGAGDEVAPAPRRNLSGNAPGASGAPGRQNSALGSGQQRDPQSQSFMQRMGIAPMHFVSDGTRDPNDVPGRSPVGAVRHSSGLTQQVIDTEKVKEEMEAKEDEGEPWHQMSDDEIKGALVLDDLEKGISEDEALFRLQRDGENKIAEKESVTMLQRFFESLIGGFQAMMFTGSILSIIVFIIDPTDIQTLVLGIMLFSVTIITSIFQAYQEGKADDVMGALRAQLADEVVVIRGGFETVIKATNLVIGDIVEVKGGDKVPADVRILSSSDLKVNNASLTGENVDIRLSKEPLHSKIFEAKNIARSGCNFTNGNGRAIVFATGDNTFFGKIAFSTTQTERPDTLMKREIHRLIMFMGIIASIIGVVFLGLSLGTGYKWDAAITFTIGIIVANVPEGLLPQLTVALALTASRLFDKHVLVTNLEIIETLGAVTTICSDKTGTLTCNRMTVSHVMYGCAIHDGEHAVTQQGDEFEGIDENDRQYDRLRRCAALCSDAVFLERKDPAKEHAEHDNILKWPVKGDASEAAIIKHVQHHGEMDDIRQKHRRLGVIPFNSTNKYMLTINEVDNNCVVFMKGAPERIFDRCSHAVDGQGNKIAFDANTRALVEDLQTNLGKRGERVIAFAELELPAGEFPPNHEFQTEGEEGIDINFPMTGLTLIGFIAMQDPPRGTVAISLRDCHKASIKVFMVTGDHPVTALAIAKNLGLVTHPTAEEYRERGSELPRISQRPTEERHGGEGHRPIEGAAAGNNKNEPAAGAAGGGAAAIAVPNQLAESLKHYPQDDSDVDYKRLSIAVHGSDLVKFTQDDWDRVLKHDEIVFARTQPQQKQDIVLQLTGKGEIVAMTGDGVNDAPALKAAHVGVAMGSGMQVAKEAAQIVILDDDFSSIVEGVREGRTIFENMKKAISYVLVSNIPQLVPFLIFIAGRTPLAMETLVILCIDLGTDILPAIALAYEEPEDSIMDKPPRGPDEHLVTTQLICVCYGTVGMFQAFCMLFAFAWVMEDAGFPVNTFHNAGPEYRKKCSSVSAGQKAWFQAWCDGNVQYRALYPGAASTCDTCYDYRLDALERGQAAAFLSIVWGQLANMVARKTSLASSLDWHRLTHNTFALVSVVVELVLVIMLTHIPGLNEGFGMRRPSSKHACVSLFVIPWIILWEEGRKALVRAYPKSCLAQLTYF